MRHRDPVALLAVTTPALALALALAVALAACTGAAPSASPSSAAAAQSPRVPADTSQPTMALGSPTVGPYGLATDPGLLSILPPTLGSLPLSESSDVESRVLSDAALPGHAAAFAAASVGDIDGSDYAFAEVVQLKADSVNDAYFAAWRRDYDASGCDQAGGVQSEESLTIAGRPVAHVTCQGGVDLYDMFLRDRGEIISIWSLGPLDLGRQIVEGLRS